MVEGSNEVGEKVIAIFKGIGEVLLILLYGIYCYLELLFRAIVPPAKKSLDGEIFLITGSGTGIGREVVLQLARDHPKTTLVLWDFNDKENQKTAADARKRGAKVHTYQLDVTDRAKVSETAKKVQAEVGDVTILFNNAGIAIVKNLLDSNPEDMEKVVQVNLISHFWTLKAFLPKMVENKRGHIVTTASLGAYFAAKMGLPYFAAKYGIRGMVESLKDEMRVHPNNPDIKFTTIFPAFVRTPLTKGVILKINNKEDQRMWLKADEVATKIISGIRENQEKIVIPKGMELHIIFKALTPTKFFNYINNKIFDGDYKEE